MKNTFKVVSIVFVTIFVFTAATCFGQSGGQTINSPEALKTYLDKQPANSPDKPIRVSMGANAPMLPKIVEAINASGKYVSLNLTGNALTTIPDKAFMDCETLAGITIPDSVTSIGDNAFSGCTSLTSITIPDNVTRIVWGAFSYCTGLTSITIPDSITTIEDGVFRGCETLASVTLPNSITTIEDDAFVMCTSLTSVIIPGKVDLYSRRDDASFSGNFGNFYVQGGTYRRISYDEWRIE